MGVIDTILAVVAIGVVIYVLLMAAAFIGMAWGKERKRLKAAQQGIELDEYGWYRVEVRHEGLGLSREMRGQDPEGVAFQAKSQMEAWDREWQATLATQAEIDRAENAVATFRSVSELLKDGVRDSQGIRFEDMKGPHTFPEEPPPDPRVKKHPPEPRSKLLGATSGRRPASQRERAIIDLDNARAQEQWKSACDEYEARKAAFFKQREELSKAIDEFEGRYRLKDPNAVAEYCKTVLENSRYPDFLRNQFEMEYRGDTGQLIVDYSLPPPEAIPRVKDYKYIESRDEIREVLISDTEAHRMYDDVVYQVALRTIYGLFDADTVAALQSVVFNGFVRSIDSATGRDIEPCICSLHATREEFMELNLESVDPKACFRRLKGVAATKLHDLAPVRPILTLRRDDGRIVEGREVQIDEGENIAAMDWQDFEHLIRNLFETEFAVNGAEVKVTQASRDRGVDALVFDPDPLRGGKFVIQAKRYTNVVPVSAVRDLYGTVINEGASRGILITTAYYGPESIEFAKDKPLVLLDGSNLLHMLEKQGRKARIDLQEAKKLEKA